MKKESMKQIEKLIKISQTLDNKGEAAKSKFVLEEAVAMCKEAGLGSLLQEGIQGLGNLGKGIGKRLMNTTPM